AEQQLKDLKDAANELTQAYPGITVHAYFVRPHGKQIHFESVD
ncbi:hypothetical protein STIAU_2880, partial [Stigmatella aurantiaca DW4/3-1]